MNPRTNNQIRNRDISECSTIGRGAIPGVQIGPQEGMDKGIIPIS